MVDTDKLNIAPLFEVRVSRPGKNVQLTESEIRGFCLKSREIFLSQPILLELGAPLKICDGTQRNSTKTHTIPRCGYFTPMLPLLNSLCTESKTHVFTHSC